MNTSNDVPWYVSLIIIIVIGLMILAFAVKPAFIRDCVARGNSLSDCEYQWKWRLR